MSVDKADIVRAGVLWGYAQLVQSLRGDPAALLARARLETEDLDDFDRYISRSAVIALLERTADEIRCPDFGMRLAGMQDINVVGALAFAIRNAPDLRSALETGARYLHFHAPTPTIAFEDAKGDLRRLIIRSGHDPRLAATQYIEHAVALIVRIIGTLTQGQVRPKQVLFAHARVAPLPDLRRQLGVTPDFEGDADAVVLAEGDLCAPLKEADRQLQAIAERYLDAHSPQPSRNAEQQLRQTLSRLMRAGPTTMQDAADALRIHPRTLQRRLKAGGVTFEQIRDEVRKDLAELYLAYDVIPIAHIADLLGYADQSVLTRSCMRWFGKTPLQMRQGRAAKAAR